MRFHAHAATDGNCSQKRLTVPFRFTVADKIERSAAGQGRAVEEFLLHQPLAHTGQHCVPFVCWSWWPVIDPDGSRCTHASGVIKRCQRKPVTRIVACRQVRWPLGRLRREIPSFGILLGYLRRWRRKANLHSFDCQAGFLEHKNGISDYVTGAKVAFNEESARNFSRVSKIPAAWVFAGSVYKVTR